MCDRVLTATERLLADQQGGQDATSPSSDLRQASPHKPTLSLCGWVVFRGQEGALQPGGDQGHGRKDEKTTMEETTSGV